MSGAITKLRELNTALVVISRETGLVLDHFGDLPISGDGLVGRDWRDALGIPADNTAVIAQALNAGVAASLPPMAVAVGSDGDRVMGGMAVPETWHGQAVLLLFLRALSCERELLEPGIIEETDVIAVLGVDRLEFSPTWGLPETEQLMMDLRAGIRQVLRDHDRVGLPAGATITLVLKDLEAEAALDVSRALLSHLHQRLARLEGGAGYARACIGLAQRLDGQSSLSALLAANGALLQAQASRDERIRFASPWDPLGMAARALGSGGAFRDAAVDEAQQTYLRELVALGLEQRSGEAAVDAVLHLTLDAGGLMTVALLLASQGTELGWMGGYTRESVEVGQAPLARAPRDLQGVLRRIRPEDLAGRDCLEFDEQGLTLLPLRQGNTVWGGLLLRDREPGLAGFRPSAAALQYLGAALAGRGMVRAPGVSPDGPAELAVSELEKGIEGYVLDNMEGAIDQAIFLASVDVPVAIVGPRGTGKHYIAQVIHAESGGSQEQLVRIDCRGFRGRNEAQARLLQELEREGGRTLVFKSPHLLHPDTQVRLARILASRTVSDEHGRRYLPPSRYVALFPGDLSQLVARGELDPRLASVFAAHPIAVPPLKDRGRAVLRWAHKILEQESAQSDRRVRGFTADAERAMLQHPWPGNISEMREMIRAALARTEKEWITPVDLGIFTGLTADGSASATARRPFLEAAQEEGDEQPDYVPSAVEELRNALAQALAAILETGVLRPLGAWLDDEIVLAALERFGGDNRGAAQFLQTRSRNVGRWMPRIQAREAERDSSLMWQESSALVRQWVLETPPLDLPPQQFAQEMLLALVLQQCGDASVADRARIMGVSTPTYQKRLKQVLQEA